MELKFDYTNLIYSNKLKKNITTAQLMNLKKEIDIIHDKIQNDRENKILGFYDLVDFDVSHIYKFLEDTDKYKEIVVLGIGGSALGNKALFSSLKTSTNLTKKVTVIDNVDPVLLYEALNSLDLDKTIFNIITKSGSTAETMAVFMIVFDILKKNIPDYKKQIVITTDKEKGFLRKIIKKENFESFVVPDNVGGRFSILSDVGLVSSAFAGIDIKKLLNGAEAMRKRCETKNIYENPAYLNALLHYWYLKNGFNISVMMPYSNSLVDFADWYRQLWAESIGKKYSLKNQIIKVGQTPVKALGTTDQHSQVQLYAEGPEDKIVTFIQVEKFVKDYKIPHLFMDRDEVNYLCSKNLSELLNCERLATEIALTNAGCPNANIIFPEINEFTIGQFIMMYEIQTVVMGKLLDINPLNQPGVEAGKIATYAMMGKKGYDTENINVKKYKEKIRKIV